MLAALVAPDAAWAGWTFCVAETSGGDEIWLTEVFAASMDRERLEGEFKDYLKSRGESGAVVQCPAAKEEKTEMLNARFTAAEFHRKLGDTMHDVKLSEFAPRR
jgi:hypothetical protein